MNSEFTVWKHCSCHVMPLCLRLRANSTGPRTGREAQHTQPHTVYVLFVVHAPAVSKIEASPLRDVLSLASETPRADHVTIRHNLLGHALGC